MGAVRPAEGSAAGRVEGAKAGTVETVAARAETGVKEGDLTHAAAVAGTAAETVRHARQKNTTREAGTSTLAGAHRHKNARASAGLPQVCTAIRA